jgi:hypothetical protein
MGQQAAVTNCFLIYNIITFLANIQRNSSNNIPNTLNLIEALVVNGHLLAKKQGISLSLEE